MSLVPSVYVVFLQPMNNEQHQRIPTILAFALLPLSGFATDIYIPSLPGMGQQLHVSNVQVQLTLTLFLISYGISQLLVGSILDSYGRYKFSMGALVVFCLSCLVIALSHNIYLICLMRILQGITVAVIIVAKRAYFVDVYEGDRLKHYLSMFTIIWSAGPIIAPFIGGYLEHLFGWQSNFYFLAILSFVIAVLEYFFSGETIRKPVPFHFKTIIGIYGTMLRTTSFTLGILMLSFGYTMAMIYNMTGPFIIEHQLNLTPVIAGYCSLLLGFAWMAGGFISRAVIKQPFHGKVLTNIAAQLLFATLMIISLIWGQNLLSMLFFAFLIHAGAGFTYNNYFTYCLSRFPQYAGISGGMTGGIVYIMVSVLSYGIVNVFPPKNEANLSYSYMILIVLSAIVMTIIFTRYYRKRAVLA